MKLRLPLAASPGKLATGQPATGQPAQDRLFGTVEAWQGDRPWGHLLDAGTGSHSLRWVLGLSTSRWTAVTGADWMERTVRQELGHRMRPVDRVVTGNWSDPGFLAGQVFDTVLADYLLGAIDGFAPYFQGRLFARLRPHVGGRLYAIGLEPYPDQAADEATAVILDIARLRDACILLAGHRCYREYPRAWVEQSLRDAGFVVEQAVSVPIVYGRRFVDGQLDVCLQKLPLFADPRLAQATRDRVEALRAQAHAVHDRLGGLRVGSDWVVAARPG